MRGLWYNRGVLLRVGEREPVRRRSNGFAAEGGANAHHRQDGALTDGGRESTRVLSENHAGAFPSYSVQQTLGKQRRDLGQSKAGHPCQAGKPPRLGEENPALRQETPVSRAGRHQTFPFTSGTWDNTSSCGRRASLWQRRFRRRDTASARRFSASGRTCPPSRPHDAAKSISPVKSFESGSTPMPASPSGQPKRRPLRRRQAPPP